VIAVVLMGFSRAVNGSDQAKSPGFDGLFRTIQNWSAKLYISKGFGNFKWASRVRRNVAISFVKC
jgi:hypothetical protein